MSYENPAMPQGGSPINKYFDAQSTSEAAYQKEKQRQDILKRQKEKERQAQINKMQEMQYKVDMLSLQRADELSKITENPTLDNEVTSILRDRIDVASQAQLYLMTDFSDNKKRAEAKKVIADYQNLLNLTQGFASSWSDITSYWNEKKDGIGSNIAVLGTDNYTYDQNQWLVNSMAGKIPNTKISLSYDEKDNDLKLVVSGKNGNGDIMPTRTISAKKWMELDDSEENDFIQEIPQIYQEYAKLLGPDNFNLLTAKGQLDPSMIKGDDISIDIGNVMSADGKTKTGTKQDIRTYYDIASRIPGMSTKAASMIAGVEGMGFNAMKNFYEFNLKMNNGDGVLPDNYKDFVDQIKKDIVGKKNADGSQVTFSQKQEEILSRLLIDQTLSSTGLKKDEEGRYYTSKINVAAVQKKSSSSAPNQTAVKNNALNAQVNMAIAQGQIDDLNQINDITIQRVPGSSNRYELFTTNSKGELISAGDVKIKQGDLYGQGAKELRRQLGLPEQYNLQVREDGEGYVAPVVSNSSAANKVMNTLIGFSDDKQAGNIQNMTFEYRGEDIPWLALQQKFPLDDNGEPTFDIIDHDDEGIFGYEDEILVRLPIMKGGKRFEKSYKIPLSESDKKELQQGITKSFISYGK